MAAKQYDWLAGEFVTVDAEPPPRGRRAKATAARREADDSWRAFLADELAHRRKSQPDSAPDIARKGPRAARAARSPRKRPKP